MTTGFLGIDIGLSGARTAILSRTGKVLASARLPYTTGNPTPQALSEAMDSSVRLALRKGGKVTVAGIAVCAFGPAPILLDQSGRIIGHLPLFGPGMTSQDDLEGRMREFRRKAPEQLSQARSICDVTGYLVSRLVGRVVMDALTVADFRRLSLPKRIRLPASAPSLDHAGPLSASAARRLGLPEGIPVAYGAYDSSADLAALGFGETTRAAIILGSTLVMGILTKRPVRDAGLRAVSHLGEGWFSGGWTNCAGASLVLAERWVKPAPSDRSGSTPLILPYFSGERAPLWSSQATGVIAGLTPATTPEDIRRAFVQGVALSAADIAGRLEKEFGRIPRWTVAGGGTGNTALMAELSDALGSRLDVVKGADQSLGPAILAARSCGTTIRLPIEKHYRPRPRKHRAYGQKLQAYRRLSALLTPVMGEIYRATQDRRTAS
jgi:xylulokinase